VHDSTDLRLLRLLMHWKSEQARRTKHVDRFACTWVTQLLEELLETKTEALRGLLSVLYAGDQPVGVQFGLQTGSLLNGWFTGYDTQFARYSPGLIQIKMMAEALPQAGVSALHMGKGAKSYTCALKNSEIFVGAGIITAPNARGAVHRLRGVASRQALQIVREHRALHDVADWLLRRTGVSSRAYGRI
jgi:CelD/BcsL family acetyltransferase involved in cellulose biosynthesis